MLDGEVSYKPYSYIQFLTIFVLILWKETAHQQKRCFVNVINKYWFCHWLHQQLLILTMSSTTAVNFDSFINKSCWLWDCHQQPHRLMLKVLSTTAIGFEIVINNASWCWKGHVINSSCQFWQCQQRLPFVVVSSTRTVVFDSVIDSSCFWQYH